MEMSKMFLSQMNNDLDIILRFNHKS